MSPGFSLFELLIALCISAILATVGYPSYAHYVQSSYRTAAEVQIMRINTTLSQYQIQKGSYHLASLDTLGWSSYIAHYRLSLTVLDDNHFTLIAQPQGLKRLTVAEVYV